MTRAPSAADLATSARTTERRGLMLAFVSVLSPTMFSAVGARSAPGRQGADLALVSATGYLGFVLGPPLVGVLSAATTLPTAIAALAALAGVIAVAGPLVLRTSASPAAADVPAGAERALADRP